MIALSISRWVTCFAVQAASSAASLAAFFTAFSASSFARCNAVKAVLVSCCALSLHSASSARLLCISSSCCSADIARASA